MNHTDMLGNVGKGYSHFVASILAYGSDEVRLKISEIYPLFDGKAVEIVRNIIIDELKMLTDIKRSI